MLKHVRRLAKTLPELVFIFQYIWIKIFLLRSNVYVHNYSTPSLRIWNDEMFYCWLTGCYASHMKCMLFYSNRGLLLSLSNSWQYVPTCGEKLLTTWTVLRRLVRGSDEISPVQSSYCFLFTVFEQMSLSLFWHPVFIFFIRIHGGFKTKLWQQRCRRKPTRSIFNLITYY